MKWPRLALPLATVVVLLGFRDGLSARIPYAKETGKRCVFCHATTNPNASDLHWAGRYYARKRTLKGFTPDQVTSATGVGVDMEALFESLSEEESVRESLQVYMTKCAACHAPTGEGTPGLNARNFTDPAWQASQSDEEIQQAIEKGRLPLMPPFAESLDKDTIQSLVNLVRRFGPTEEKDKEQ